MTEAASSEKNSSDVRPLVATGNSSRLGVVAFIVLMLIGGAWIFSLMSEQRSAMQGTQIGAAPEAGARISSPPPLSLPRDFGREDLGPRPLPTPVVVRQQPIAPVPQPKLSRTQVPAPAPIYYTPAQTAVQPPSVVYAAPELPRIEDTTAGQDGAVGRIKAARFINPSHTIPQGTVIPAVLETALDSTRPGGVRALVQRDIYSFDGTRVLVHRGSRLYGEYDAQLQRGQNRALIRWTRLIRPDGVTVALDSPASDPLGRAGVKGKVDGKFFQRFGGALLQSVLDIGVGVAAREASDGVIVALPGSTQNVAPRLSENDIVPTLKVRHGTSVSVFVAHDLDFSSVDS